MNEVNWSVSIIEESLRGEKSGPDRTVTVSAVEDATSREAKHVKHFFTQSDYNRPEVFPRSTCSEDLLNDEHIY